MTDWLKQFTHIFVICGDNDVNSAKAEDILHNYICLIRALKTSVVRISGILPRADIIPEKRSTYKKLLREKLQMRYKSPKLLKSEDFNENLDPAHLFDLRGKEHYMQHILSFLHDSFGVIYY